MSNKNHNTTSKVHAVLYTRKGCHLCEDALQLLRQHGVAPTSIDIDDDPALREQFGMCVPAVEIDGRIRFRGVINQVLLRRIIARQEETQ